MECLKLSGLDFSLGMDRKTKLFLLFLFLLLFFLLCLFCGLFLPSGVSGSPSFLPGRTPNHFGSLAFGLFDHSLNFSFQRASSSTALITSQPPSYSFFLSP